MAIKLNLILFIALFILFVDQTTSSTEASKDYYKYDLVNDQKKEENNGKQSTTTNQPNLDDKSTNGRNEITESPLDALIAFTSTPIKIVHEILIGDETSIHAKEISEIISMNMKEIIIKFFKIANDALDNLDTINNAGVISMVVQFASFMTKVQSTFNNYADPNQWQSSFSMLKVMNLPNNIPNLRLPLNLRSPNANHEQFFDAYF